MTTTDTVIVSLLCWICAEQTWQRADRCSDKGSHGHALWYVLWAAGLDIAGTWLLGAMVWRWL